MDETLVVAFNKIATHDDTHECEEIVAPMHTHDLISVLPRDVIGHIASFLDSDHGCNLTCFRLTCLSFRDHSMPPQRKLRGALFKSVPLLEYVWEHRDFKVSDVKMWTLAIQNGSPDVLDWMFSKVKFDICNMRGDVNKGFSDETAFTLALQAGNIDVLSWLKDKGCPWDLRSYQNVLDMEAIGVF